jgi:hypothetical protein
VAESGSAVVPGSGEVLRPSGLNLVQGTNLDTSQLAASTSCSPIRSEHEEDVTRGNERSVLGPAALTLSGRGWITRASSSLSCRRFEFQAEMTSTHFFCYQGKPPLGAFVPCKWL